MVNSPKSGLLNNNFQKKMYICKKRMYYAESDGKKNMDYEDSP